MYYWLLRQYKFLLHELKNLVQYHSTVIVRTSRANQE